MKRKLLYLLTILLALPTMGHAASKTVNTMTISNRKSVTAGANGLETFSNGGYIALTGYSTTAYTSSTNELHIYKVTFNESLPDGFVWNIQGGGYGSATTSGVVNAGTEAILYSSTATNFVGSGSVHLYLQNNSGSSQALTITSMSEAIWAFDNVSSEIVYTNSSGSAVASATIDKSAFSGAHVGDVIDFNITRKGSGANYTVKYNDNATDASRTILLPELALPATGNRYVPISSSEMLANLKSYGLVISGNNVVPTSISIIQTEESELDTEETEGTLLQFNAGGSWNAQKGSITWSNNDSGKTYTSGVVTFNHNSFNGKWNGLTGSNWVGSLTSGDTHRFTLKMNEGAPAGFYIYAAPEQYGDFQKATAYVAKAIDEGATAVSFDVTQTDYRYIYIVNEGTSGSKLNIAYFARTTITAAPAVNAPTITPASGTYNGSLSVTITPGEDNDKVIYSVSGSNEDVSDVQITAATVLNLTGTGTITVTATGYVGEETSTLTINTYTYKVENGKSSVAYTIPGKAYSLEDHFDANVSKWSKLNLSSGSSWGWDSTEGHSSAGSMKVVNASNNSSEQWRVQLKAALSPSIASGTDFYVSYWIKCEEGTGSVRCSTQGQAKYQGDQNVTTEWQQVVWHVTGTTGDQTGLCFDIAKVANTYYIDDVEVYTDAPTGGSNVFTTSNQVANIAASEFTSLNTGDYVCANVTPDGDVEDIKLVCNGNTYNLTQFNDNLWGIKATADIRTALMNNATEFKGYPLTLNSIDIFETKEIGEGDNTIENYEDVFVELSRSFVKDTWNTVCLPFVPTAAQAEELFGAGYKIAAFTGVDDGTMQFETKTISEFEAGVPYLVKPTEDLSGTVAMALADVDITARKAQTVTFSGYSFKGTFTTTTFTENLSNCLFVATGNKLKHPTNGSTLKALRAYFEIPAADGARSFSFSIDGDDGDGLATGIDNATRLTTGGVVAGAVHDLQGRKVEHPTRGLYIMNGRKVVVK